jgi:hypothetical protein
MYRSISRNKENIMQFQYEKSIKDDTPLEDQIPEVAREFKEMKKVIIRQAIESMTGRPYNWDEVKDKVKYSDYTNTKHIFFYENKPILKFTPTDIQTKDNLIVCSLEYVELYRKAGT